MPVVKRERGKRKPLSEALGKLTSEGSKVQAGLLEKAFKATQASGDELTHGFHSYPARMHHLMARTLVRSLTSAGNSVLDPFCGGGTVPIESMLAGCKAIGTDLNPLAIRVAEVKSELRGLDSRERFLETLQEVADASERRVRERVPIRAKLSKSEVSWYEPHTLMELAGLLREVQAVGRQRDLRAMEVLFSAIVVKFAQQRSDTSVVGQSKRIRKGLPTEFFFRRGRELVRRWAALEEEAGKRKGRHPVKAPRWIAKDARHLPRTLAPIDLVLTSPPYPGVYDYAEHHQRRFAWLGIRSEEFVRQEIGARRRQYNDDALSRWEGELHDSLQSMAKVLSKKGDAILLLGDGRFGRKPVEVKAMMRELVPAAKMRLVATTTAHRPGPRGRPEHLFWLQRK